MFLEPEHCQVGSLVKDMQALNQELIEFLPIDIVVELESLPGEIMKSTLKNWKNDLQTKFPGMDFTFIENDNYGITSSFKVDLSKEGPSCFDFPCLNAQNVSVRKPVKNFMKFIAKAPTRKTEPIPETFQSTEAVKQLATSFKHGLTKIGELALYRLEHDLINRIQPWIGDPHTSFIAPVVSLCQSSGTGKSKLAFEALKRHLGFYIVFREDGQTGYPRKNELSDLLRALMNDYKDPSEDLNDFNYQDCTVGAILFFFAQIITSSIIASIRSSEGKLFEHVIIEHSKKFENNSDIKCDYLTPDQEIFSLIGKSFELKADGVISVKNVSSYIKLILKDPSKCFEQSSLTNDQKLFCSALAEALRKFPFLFVVDEAEILSKHVTLKSVNGKNINQFEALRRAFSYLEPETNILFLTLGTKSNIIDLNPDITEESKRLKKRKKLPFPIILSSNLNIWSRKFPAYSVNPSYEAILNPLYFKYLCTLGHGIWSSFHFGAVVSTGAEKIVNGTSKSFDYVIVLWMILTGMAANPLSVEAGSIVAKHMGYLLDISEDLKRLIVMYPPEPILAIIAHTIIDNQITDDALFSVLQRKLEATDIDRGKMAELFGGMIILRAIWKSPLATLERKEIKEFEHFQKHIKENIPALNYIWDRNHHILQERVPSDVESEIQECNLKIGDILKSLTEELERGSRSEAELHFKKDLELRLDNELKSKKKLKKELLHLKDGNLANFSSYKVHKVSGFLNTLLDINNDKIQHKFPEEILDGLVNGTHLVSLDSFSENLSFETGIAEVQKPKLADERIADTSRCIITEDMLRLCITMQLIIKFPPGYYGLDYAIPVLLRDETVTFIGVQIKRANANSTDDVYKMRSKLHFVPCSDPNCIGTNCRHCTQTQSLDLIYKKQLSIILSLDEDEKFSCFSLHSTSYFPGCPTKDQGCLTNFLLSGNESALTTTTKSGKRTHLRMPIQLASPSFFSPLISSRIPLKDDILLIKSLWCDKHVNLANIKLSKTKTIKFVPDKFVHRQFCISVRGWGNFSKLFTDCKSCTQIAQRLMNPEGLIKHFPIQKGNSDFIRKINYDLSLTFPFYSEELRLASGGESLFEKLCGIDAKKNEEDLSRGISDMSIGTSESEKSPGHKRLKIQK